MAADPVTVIAGLFASEGAADYLGEPLTQAQHMLQAGALAEAARFEADPYAMDACQVRRWDDGAKDPDALNPSFAHFSAVLRKLL